MAHFAKINNNNIVERVIGVHNNELLVDGVENEQKGVDFINKTFGTNDTWKQTSYNTDRGTHRLGGTPFRKNYAGRGHTYDEARDAFIAPKAYPSWILNETTCLYDAPKPYPDPTKHYVWDEDTVNWVIDPNIPDPQTPSP